MMWLIAQVAQVNSEETKWPRWVEDIAASREITFVITGAILLILIVIAAWIAMKIRGFATHENSQAIEHLTEFEDLYDRGAFSDQEMSKLKEVIRSNLDDPTGNEEQQTTNEVAEEASEITDQIQPDPN